MKKVEAPVPVAPKQNQVAKEEQAKKAEKIAVVAEIKKPVEKVEKV